MFAFLTVIESSCFVFNVCIAAKRMAKTFPDAKKTLIVRMYTASTIDFVCWFSFYNFHQYHNLGSIAILFFLDISFIEVDDQN